MFDPFFRSDAVKRAGIAGVGLGLAVAARIVDAHGDRIGVDDLPEGGSRFVTL